MRLAVLFLSVACLALWSAVAHGKPLMVLSSPNILRVEATENIFVECQRDGDAVCQSQEVDISVLNHPTRTRELAKGAVNLNAGNNFQAFVEIKIPADEFKDDPELKQHVALEATFADGTQLKKTVLVTLQSSYIFIQTDKPLYTPDSEVKFRMFGVTPDMRPVGNGGNFININIVTPDNIVIPKPIVALRSGIYSGAYTLPDIARVGNWRLEATFQNNKQKNYSAEFEVKEYVLPSFEVKITIDKEYFYVDDEELNVAITATYLFGKEVQGDAYVVFGLFDSEKRKQSIPGSFQTVQVKDGQAKAKLTRAQIQKSFDIDTLEKSSLYISVSVLTESGSELVEAEKHGIHIVKSPYTIHFQNSPKYFKPTMFFQIGISVELPDGSPASGVPLLVNPGAVEVITSQNGFARAPVNPDRSSPDRLTITATTADPHILPSRQKTESITVTSYSSAIKRYLQIEVGSSEARVGSTLQVSFDHNAASTTKTITYLIQSAGRLVKHGKTSHSHLTSIALPLVILPEMLPSFRIIAYYNDQDEVVSDSVWVDVVERCMGSLRLTTKKNLPSSPREKYIFKITGDPGSTVGLVAVDKGVYVLNNKHRLTQKKVWGVVQEADTGCTPGGGRNNMAVFYDAGLMFHSNLQQTVNREDSKCPTPPTRTGRSAPTLDVRSSLLGNYTEPLLRECCLDGMEETVLSYSCERRSKYISDGPACAEAFLKCCTKLTELRTENQAEALLQARSTEKNIVFKDSGQIDTRSKFPESWMWLDVELPLCLDGTTTSCKETSVEQVKALEDSITTWHLTGISLSPDRGICVDDTFKIVVQKNFFIDLRLPYSAVRREQIEIKAVLHNYLYDEITVEVHLREVQDVCSSAYKHGEYTVRVKVAAASTRSVPFIIIPMKAGNIPITVKASVGNQQLEDGVTKNLRVVPEGIKKIVRETRSVKVNRGDPKKLEIIKNIVNTTFLVKDSPENSEIYVSGGSQMNVLVEKVLSGTSMGRLIKQPYGCGEQNMITMTLPLIATVYLDKTNQWDVAGDSKREEALGYIRDGYNRELNYKTPDGAFTTFVGGSGISWLTSYVAKVFAMAYHLENVDLKIVCGAIKWVILNAQMPDGSIEEIGKVVHGEMMGNVRGMDTDASMTAFSLIAMQEAEPHCTNDVNSLTQSITKAVGYLEKRLKHLTNPYAVAMVSYALANANKLDKAILFKFASQDSDHWPVMGSYHFTVEATAYALLALVKAKEFEDATPIVKWMKLKGHPDGGFSSTQATIMAYQALAEYWINAKEQRYEMDIDMKIAGRSNFEPTIRITNQNAFQTRTTNFKGLNKEVNVTASGSGEATVSIVSMYYAAATDQENNCKKFDLNVTVTQGTDANLNTLTLKIKFLYKDPNADSGMVILDIGMLTGYMAVKDDLNKLTNSKAKIIARYEEDKVLSDRGSIIIYLDKVSHKEEEEVAFKIQQEFKVGVLQPAAVSIYDYYNAQPCRKFYHPARKDGHLINLCRGAVCKCAEEECSMQKKVEISDELRLEKICDAQAKINYAYKVYLSGYDDSDTTDYYYMRIDMVIKEGSGDKSPAGKHRRFVGYSHCKTALGLKSNRSYLIMGSLDTEGSKDINSQYVLGESTWLEYWPTREECQSEKYQETCNGLDTLVYSFVETGCID